MSPNYIHTYECEVSAREEEARYWGEINRDGTPSSYFDELKAVYEARFMNEYVWKYHRQPNWAEPSILKELEFEKWLKEEIPNHKPLMESGLKVMVSK